MTISNFYDPLKNYSYNLISDIMNSNYSNNNNSNINGINEYHTLNNNHFNYYYHHHHHKNVTTSNIANATITGTLDGYINLAVNNLSDYLVNNLTANDTTLINENFNNNSTTNFNFTNVIPKKDFVFDRSDVKIIFITLYSLVFCCCFFGKYL